MYKTAVSIATRLLLQPVSSPLAGSTNNAFNNSLDNIAEVQPGESDEGEERPAGKSVTGE